MLEALLYCFQQFVSPVTITTQEPQSVQVSWSGEISISLSLPLPSVFGGIVFGFPIRFAAILSVPKLKNPAESKNPVRFALRGRYLAKCVVNTICIWVVMVVGSTN